MLSEGEFSPLHTLSPSSGAQRAVASPQGIDGGVLPQTLLDDPAGRPAVCPNAPVLLVPERAPPASGLES